MLAISHWCRLCCWEINVVWVELVSLSRRSVVADCVMHAIVMMSGWWFCCSIVEDTVGSYADDELPPSKVSFIQFCMLQMRFICSTKPNIQCRDWDTADAAVARFLFVVSLSCLWELFWLWWVTICVLGIVVFAEHCKCHLPCSTHCQHFTKITCGNPLWLLTGIKHGIIGRQVKWILLTHTPN